MHTPITLGSTLAAPPGPLTDFNKSRGCSWTIATTTGGIANFDTNRLALDTSAFANDWSSGRFALAVAGNNLVLNFAAAPAPPRSTNGFFQFTDPQAINYQQRFYRTTTL